MNRPVKLLMAAIMFIGCAIAANAAIKVFYFGERNISEITAFFALILSVTLFLISIAFIKNSAQE